MNKSASSREPWSGSGKGQRGAVLFIALMILVVLSLLAVSAGQVTSLQERMASAYWTDMRTLESSEALVRRVERSLIAAVPGDTPFPGFEDPCSQGTLASNAGVGWASNWTPTPDGYEFLYENTARGVGARGSGVGGSLLAARQVDGNECSMFRVTAVRVDDPADPTAKSVVQSIFVF